MNPIFSKKIKAAHALRNIGLTQFSVKHKKQPMCYEIFDWPNFSLNIHNRTDKCVKLHPGGMCECAN